MKLTLAPVISNVELMPDTYLMWLECPQIAAIARPGQFVMVRCGGDTLLRRPLSVHQVDGDKIALLFTIAGKGTHWLSQCQPGDTADIFGPMGNGYTIHPDSENLLLVAGGIGIAPLRFLAQEALKSGGNVAMLIGAESFKLIYPTELLPEGIERPIITTTDDGSEGHKGLVTDLIPEYIAEADQVFACGPFGMYKTMAEMPELKDKPVQLSLEIMMGCGVGVCYGCTIRTKSGLKQVCKDGPVFELKDIIWDETGVGLG